MILNKDKVVKQQRELIDHKQEKGTLCYQVFPLKYCLKFFTIGADLVDYSPLIPMIDLQVV